MLMMDIYGGTRENPVANIPVEYEKLYTECWSEDPDKRPKMVDILNQLRKMGASEKPPVPNLPLEADSEHSKPVQLVIKVSKNNCVKIIMVFVLLF